VCSILTYKAFFRKCFFLFRAAYNMALLIRPRFARYQLSVVSNQLSAVSRQLSAFSVNGPRCPVIGLAILKLHVPVYGAFHAKLV